MTALSFWQEIADKGVQAVANAISDAEAIELAERYGTHNYHPLPVNIVSAKGAFATDGDGNEYIDFIGSYSALSHGHLSDFVIDVAKKQMDKLTLVSRAMYSTELGLFLKAVCEYTEMDMACPMNTGAEAVETAIKLARKWGYRRKGIAKDKAEIIVADGNFHGRTTTIVSFSPHENYKNDFGPFPAGFKMVPFGDANALRAAITPNTCAVLMEPIQAEGGIMIPPVGFMEEARRICTENNVLLIWDEIQTGFCRTGRKFAWQHEDAEPDMMCLGKALGGGLMPVAATVGKKHVMEMFVPGDHGSTFGGNPLAAAIAIAAMAECEIENLTERAERSGERFMKGLRAMNHPLVKDVRGRGLLIGLEIHEHVDEELLTAAFLKERMLTKVTHQNTYRFAPPLIVDDATMDEALVRVKRALDSVS